MYLRSYEMPKFWKIHLSQETKRALNFISKECGENKIKFTTFENKWIYTLLITDNVDNPIDIIEITKRETEAYKYLFYNF